MVAQVIKKSVKKPVALQVQATARNFENFANSTRMEMATEVWLSGKNVWVSQTVCWACRFCLESHRSLDVPIPASDEMIAKVTIGMTTHHL